MNPDTSNALSNFPLQGLIQFIHVVGSLLTDSYRATVNCHSSHKAGATFCRHELVYQTFTLCSPAIPPVVSMWLKKGAQRPNQGARTELSLVMPPGL